MATLTITAATGKTNAPVAQSIAWAYAPGPEPHRESDPLDLGAVGRRAVSFHYRRETKGTKTAVSAPFRR